MRAPTRTYRSFLMDSTRWAGYQPRPGDVVISTPAKSGTTWMQRIVACLLLGSPTLPDRLSALSPWLDRRIDGRTAETVLGILEAQRHRRFIKTHLPADALPVHASVRYIAVGRDPRDTAMSFHRFVAGAATVLSTVPPPVGDDVHTPVFPGVPDDPREYWSLYFTRSAFPWESAGWPANSPFHHLSSWWRLRNAENVLFVHYEDMLNDLDGEMRRVARFLDVDIDPELWPDLVHACGFDQMRADAGRTSPAVGLVDDPASFFRRGGTGQWRDVVPRQDAELCDQALDGLEPTLREWLVREA